MNRNKLFRGRVNEHEHRAIVNAAKKANLSITDLVLKLIRYKKPKK